MALTLDIQYRGDLSSCNYSCAYCPFAKTKNDADELAADAAALSRFVAWLGARRDGSFRVLFTPWGEALIHRAYRDALVALSHEPQVRRVAAQTNLSGPLDFLAGCRPETTALWCTYHPSQTSEAAFLARCARLDALGIRYSVGMVGLREDFEAVERMRARLPDHVYLWVNAYKRVADYYAHADLARLEAVDPLFRLNVRRYESRGRACRAGSTAIALDGRGDVRRCHFVRDVIGNIYEPAFERALEARRCPNDTCGCYLGYLALEDLGLDRVYGDGLMERIPAASLARASGG